MAAPESWPADGLENAPALRRAGHSLVRPLLRGLFGLKVSGQEHIPERGPVIIAANHVSNLDGPVLAVAAESRRFVRGLGKIELYRVPVLGWYLRNAGTIPLDRKGDVRAMRAAIDLLAAGGCLLMFPEGTRSKTGKRGPAKAGVGFVAAQAKAKVVPAHVINTEHFPPRGAVEARFGEPLTFDGDPHDRAACRKFGEDVLDRAFNL